MFFLVYSLENIKYYKMMKWSFPYISLPNSFEHPFIEERPSTKDDL